jgi:acetyl coenzyme A synthetase (ADP forming)-like protein
MIKSDVGYLNHFFKPQSIAVVGASRQPRKIGHVIFKNLLDLGYQGKVYPVNPNATTILNRRVYSSVSEIDDEIEMAILATPASLVPASMEDIAKSGVKAAIIISGGFKEIGEEGKKLEDEALRIAKGAGIRLIGPNCMGIYDTYNYIDTLFLPRYRLKRPSRGDIAFISQSGAFGAAVLDWAAELGVGISKFVSLGNKADIDEVEILRYLVDDPTAKCIAVYIEGTNRGREFSEVLTMVSKKKPVIVLKGGMTPEGESAALSHTGILAGTPQIYEGMIKQTGAIRAETAEELLDFSVALSHQPLPNGEKVMVVTNAGGFGVLTADSLSKIGLKLAKPDDEIIKQISSILPQRVIVKNPLDLVGDADAERYRIALEALVKDKTIDSMIVIILVQTPEIDPEIVDVLTNITSSYNKPLLVTTVGGELTQMLTKMFTESGISTYPTPERTAKAIKALTEYANHRKRVTSGA